MDTKNQISNLADSYLRQFIAAAGTAYDQYTAAEREIILDCAIDTADLQVLAMGHPGDENVAAHIRRDQAQIAAQLANVAAIGERKAADIFWGVVNDGLASAMKIAVGAAIAAA